MSDVSPDLQLSDMDLLLGRDARRQLVEFDRNPPNWVEDEGLWDQAKQDAAESRDESDPIFWGLVTHIYKQAGGRVR